MKLLPEFKFFGLLGFARAAHYSLGPAVAFAYRLFEVLGHFSLGQYAGLLNFAAKTAQ